MLARGATTERGQRFGASGVRILMVKEAVLKGQQSEIKRRPIKVTTCWSLLAHALPVLLRQKCVQK